MATPSEKEKELWVGWTRDAMSRYQLPEDIEDVEEQVDDMVQVATKYADGMLDEFEERFSKTSSKASRRRKAADEDE